MWTNENRGKYKRDQLRYPSDMTDEEWTLCRTAMREVFNGVMYVLSTGCQWRYIPKDLPPKSTVYRYFCEWGYDGVLDRIHQTLYVLCREKLESEASPTAAIIDSQSVKSAEKGGPVLIHMASTLVN